MRGLTELKARSLQGVRSQYALRDCVQCGLLGLGVTFTDNFNSEISPVSFRNHGIKNPL